MNISFARIFGPLSGEKLAAFIVGFFIAVAVPFSASLAQTTVAGSLPRNLNIGDVGSDVSALQKTLIADGFLRNTVPLGYFGPLTAASVASWQASAGLPRTGYFGPLSRAAIGGATFTLPLPPIFPPPTANPPPSTAPPPFGEKFIRNLNIGDVGSDVSALQKTLIADGFLRNTVPLGYFGPLTAASVASWQASAGLPRTGYFGPLSRAAIGGINNSSVAIPATMFGMSVNSSATFPLKVSYGTSRIWDTAHAQQSNLYLCPSVGDIPNCQTNPSAYATFNWTNLDTVMSGFFNDDVRNVMYTLWRTPGWAVNTSTDPTGQGGTECDYYYGNSGGVLSAGAPGQCLLPVDLNADGSGPDAIWRNFVTQLALHVNNQSYLVSHAHIGYYEVCNECWRSNTLFTPGWKGHEAYEGSYAQLLRMNEDLKCILTGTGTIHNYPSVGQGTPCASAGYATTGIDPTAKIVLSSGTFFEPGKSFSYNFMYCDDSPRTPCNWGNGANWGAAVTDILNHHGNGSVYTPENMLSHSANWRSGFTAADLQKPIMCGECSYGNPSRIFQTHFDQAAFIPRWLALETTAGYTFNEWYDYDICNDGCLVNSQNGFAPIHPVIDSWNLTYQKLLGATSVSTAFCSADGTLWTCPFTESNGKFAELVWDSQYGPGGTVSPAHCSDIICGSTSYQVPPSYDGLSFTMDGISHHYAPKVTVGAVPIVLESR